MFCHYPANLMSVTHTDKKNLLPTELQLDFFQIAILRTVLPKDDRRHFAQVVFRAQLLGFFRGVEFQLLHSATVRRMPRRGRRSKCRQGGHPWTQTTLSEVAPGFSSPVSAVSSGVEWFKSTHASRGCWGQRRGIGRVGQSVRSTKQSTVPSRSCNLCGTSASGAFGNSVGSPRDTGPEVMLQMAEESEAGRTRATSGCPEKFVRAVRHQSTKAFDGARRGEDPFSFRVGRRPKVVLQGCERRQQSPRRFLCHPASSSQSVEDIVLLEEMGTNSRRHVRQVAAFCLSQTVWAICPRGEDEGVDKRSLPEKY